MKMQPWASFCMSTYKRPAFLEKQLRCILQQDFTNFEIVVSDNDPLCSGRDVVSAINDPRVRYFSNGSDIGMVKSFNHSLSKAQGEYIVMITDDDPVYPFMLSTLHDLSVKYPGYGVYQGACEIMCHTPEGAHTMRSKVGINSCLMQTMAIGDEAVFSKEEFPYLFFKSKIGSLLLWSTGIVKAEILRENGGMPDYGTEFFTDHAYNLVNCSHLGMVFVNKSLGYQDIHGGNFGFTNLAKLEKYEAIPVKFMEWVGSKLSTRGDWQALQKEMSVFTGRSLVEFSLFIRKSLMASNSSLESFNKSVKKVFSHPGMAKWSFKYLMLAHFPRLSSFLLSFLQPKATS